MLTDADARGSEAIYLGDELVGRATSGGYGWRVGKSLALAMVRPQHAARRDRAGNFDPRQPAQGFQSFEDSPFRSRERCIEGLSR